MWIWICVFLFDFLLVVACSRSISSHVFFFSFRFVGAVAGQSSCIMQRAGYDSRLVVGRPLSRSLLGILCVRGIRVLGRWKFKEVGGVCIIVYV